MLAWLAHFIERHPRLHRGALAVWRRFPPRVAGFLKGLLTRHWMVGAVAVIIDEGVSPPEILLVHHSYRRTGAWGLPGGALESISDHDDTHPDGTTDNVIETALRREVWEELGIEIEIEQMLRVEAVPYVAEEPGPYRLDFYFRCRPEHGIDLLRAELNAGRIKPRSPEISEIRLVPLPDVLQLDLYSSDNKFFRETFPLLEPALFTSSEAGPETAENLSRIAH